jgi:hypothetical protein
MLLCAAPSLAAASSSQPWGSPSVPRDHVRFASIGDPEDDDWTDDDEEEEDDPDEDEEDEDEEEPEWQVGAIPGSTA